jgi:asparagine synthase (glutamine-hydrolysing)
MSVQAGIWNFDGSPIDPELLTNFSESLKQQGPDDEFCYLDRSIALLYRPFHTTPESRREKQPYRSRRNFVITWDGRLDNRDVLSAELQNDLEADPTDVAIVGASFDRWENDCFRRIVGDWAISIWRPEQRELIFGTDYMAIRHIFYYLKKGRIWWSTDLGSLVLLSGDRFHIDDDYVAGYFANDPEGHVTPYREIREVPPGQFVRIRNGMGTVLRYWSFSPKSRIRYKTDGEYEEHFRHVLRQSVRRRLRADTPILAELSGGLDSSSIVCMADRITATEGVRTPRLDTLSYYDETEPNGDDWIYFLKIEDKRGRVGAHIDASKYGEATSIGSAGFAPLPGYLGAERQIETERAEVVRNGGYRAILSGVGGDEFLGGVPDPSAQLADLIVQFKLVRLVQQLIAWSLVKRRPLIQLLGQALADLLPTSLRQYFVRQAKVEPWIDADFARRTRIGIRALDVDEHFGLWLPTRRSYIGGVQLISHKLAKVRTRPMLAMEETRYPYLDQNLIEFILSIPASQMLRPGERRSLMRRSLIGIVPHEILSRPTKATGARTPVRALEQNWSTLHSALGSALISGMGYVNQARLVETLDSARNGKTFHMVSLFKAISLEFWLRDLATRDLLHSRDSFAASGVLLQTPTTPGRPTNHFRHAC